MSNLFGKKCFRKSHDAIEKDVSHAKFRKDISERMTSSCEGSLPNRSQRSDNIFVAK